MKPLSSEEINKLVTQATFKHIMNRTWRIGQIFMIELFDNHKEHYRHITDSNLDCFYDDTLLESACVVLAEEA
jgi:hypothetical protein